MRHSYAPQCNGYLVLLELNKLNFGSCWIMKLCVIEPLTSVNVALLCPSMQWLPCSLRVEQIELWELLNYGIGSHWATHLGQCSTLMLHSAMVTLFFESWTNWIIRVVVTTSSWGMVNLDSLEKNPAHEISVMPVAQEGKRRNFWNDSLRVKLDNEGNWQL